jgi:hypothetical protein
VGKGLSPLQKDILAGLAEIPALEESPPGDLSAWARPGQIIGRLKRPSTASNRAAVSKALLRLYERGLVARASGEVASVGMSFRYVRISNPANAGLGNDGPSMTQGARKPMKTVRESGGIANTTRH